MLLNIYLATTGACLAIDTISFMAIYNKLKRDGYEAVKTKKSFSEILYSYLKTVLLVAVPVVNLLFTGALLSLSDKKIDKLGQEMYKDGVITKKLDAMTYDEKIAAIRKKKAELEELKESLGEYKSADVDFEDNFRPNKHGFSL